MSTVGFKGMTFAGLSMKYAANEGASYDGKSVPAVDVTADDDTEMRHAAGDKPNWGQVKATILIDADSIQTLDSLIGTAASLVFSYNITDGSSDTTNANRTGNAILLEAPEVHKTNTAVLAAAVFQWVTKPTTTNQAA